MDVASELAAIKERLARFEPANGPLDRKALMERGYTEREAYGLLRAHGVRLPGGRRARISREVLDRIERGEAL